MKISVSGPIFTHKNLPKALWDNDIHTAIYERKILWQFFIFMELEPFSYYFMTTVCTYFWLIHWISLFDHHNLFVLVFRFICWISPFNHQHIKRKSLLWDNDIHTTLYERKVLWQLFKFMELYPFSYYCMTTLCTYFWLIHWISLLQSSEFVCTCFSIYLLNVTFQSSA